MSKSLARKYAELFDKKPDDYEYHTQLFGEMVRLSRSVKNHIGWSEFDFDFDDGSRLDNCRHKQTKGSIVKKTEIFIESSRLWGKFGKIWKLRGKTKETL